MSGRYGWDDGADNSSSGKDAGYDDYVDNNMVKSAFSKALKPYKDPMPSRINSRVNVSTASNGNSVVVSPDDILDMKAKAMMTPIPIHPKVLKSEAKSVVTVVLDVTGSMSEWTTELFARLPLLYGELQKYLGEDLEILFAAFSDVYFGGRIQITKFGRGRELENCILSIENDGGGGGNGVESAELVAYYLANYVDTSSARNCYTYFVTDEGINGKVLPELVKKAMSSVDNFRPMMDPIDTKFVMQRLLVRGSVFSIMSKTNTFSESYKQTWIDALGSDERVLILDDARRLVDVLIGVVAKVTDQDDQFTKDLILRQGGTQYGSVNIANVKGTLAVINGSKVAQPTSTARMTKSLI